MNEIVELVEEVCGIYFRSILLPMAGIRVPQHKHDHDHATYIGAGAARMYVDGAAVGDFYAGQAAPVRAGHEHSFEALEPNTRLACIHDVASALAIKKRGL